MEEFGSLDDDIYEIKEKFTSDQQAYIALQCEPGWFMSSNQNSSGVKEFLTFKYKADQNYLKENYKEAINCYEIYMENCSNINLPAKRECLEGISRSYMALNCSCNALKYAKDLQELSSTFDCHAVSLSLLFDLNLSACRFKESIAYGQKLLTLHSSNSNLWIKLGYAYSCLFKVPLGHTFKLFISKSTEVNKKCCSNDNFLKCECIETAENTTENLVFSEGIYLVTVCLLHSLFLLKSVENNTNGFTRTQNLVYQNNIMMDVEELALSVDLKGLREEVRKLHIYSYKYDEELTGEEFLDRASSKFKNKEQVNFVLQCIDEKTFEEKWLLVKNLQ